MRYAYDDATCFLREGYRVFDGWRYGRVIESQPLRAAVRMDHGEIREVDQYEHALRVVERHSLDNPPREIKRVFPYSLPRTRKILCMDGLERNWMDLAVDQIKRLKEIPCEPLPF